MSVRTLTEYPPADWTSLWARNWNAEEFVHHQGITTLQRDELIAQDGMIIYNKTVNEFQGFQNGNWVPLRDGGYTGNIAFNGQYVNSVGGVGSAAGGSNCTASGDNSFAMGGGCTASGNYSHAEGALCTASGIASHAEGLSATASGYASHAEGNTSQASGDFSHAEGSQSVASGEASHAEGLQCTASGNFSHAEGSGSIAFGAASHAEGFQCTATGNYSHAEGYSCTASGNFSHAGGDSCTASGDNSFSHGNLCVSSGGNSYSQGLECHANNSNSHASGRFTRANEIGVFIHGIYGSGATGTNGGQTGIGGNGGQYSIQLAGGDSPPTNPGDGISVIIRTALFGTPQPVGEIITDYFTAQGADYAEYFEWEDGNPNNEDRVGHFVELTVDGKIGIAKNSKHVIGVVSGAPSVVGDSASRFWDKTILRDDFGRPIITTLPDGTKTTTVNPDYDPTKQYIPRSQRKEWTTIGLLGKLCVRDDGSCHPGCYCSCENGIAVHKQCKTSTIGNDCRWKVIKRISKNVVQILYTFK